MCGHPALQWTADVLTGGDDDREEHDEHVGVHVVETIDRVVVVVGLELAQEWAEQFHKHLRRTIAVNRISMKTSNVHRKCLSYVLFHCLQWTLPSPLYPYLQPGRFRGSILLLAKAT
jgi:hypothetical protein